MIDNCQKITFNTSTSEKLQFYKQVTVCLNGKCPSELLKKDAHTRVTENKFVENAGSANRPATRNVP
jgi:hypothetical protein